MYIFSDEFQSIPLLPVPVTTAESINKVVYIHISLVMFVHTCTKSKKRYAKTTNGKKCWI